jgi:hypothetical protein
MWRDHNVCLGLLPGVGICANQVLHDGRLRGIRQAAKGANIAGLNDSGKDRRFAFAQAYGLLDRSIAQDRNSVDG